MEIHQVVHNATLQVVSDLIDDAMLPDINELYVCENIFLLIDCLVNLFVIANAVEKILGRDLGVLANVVRGRGFHLHNI
jgi:hypothetical protein